MACEVRNAMNHVAIIGVESLNILRVLRHFRVLSLMLDKIEDLWESF
jgi:hypothetical protein